jgi:PAS domain S-box-containing protein
MDRTTLRELRRKAKRFDELERAVGELQQRYRALESIVPDPLVFCDSDGKIEYVNARFEETFGWLADEVRGKVAPYLPRSQRAEHLKRLREIADGRVPPFRFHGQSKNGTVMDFTVHATFSAGKPEIPAGYLTVLEFVEPGEENPEDQLPKHADSNVETVSEQRSDEPAIDVMNHCERGVRLPDGNAGLLERSRDLENELGRVTGDLKLTR